MNDLKRFQAAATEMAAAMFPDDRPGPELADALIARLCEETGELARTVRKLTRKRFGHPGEAVGTPEAVCDELGDCLFLLGRIAELSGVELSEASAAVIAKLERRISEAGHSAPSGG